MEYHELTVEQKKELHELRSNNPGVKTGKCQKYNGKDGGQHNNEHDDEATTDAEKYITSVVHMMVAKMHADSDKTELSKPKVTL